MLQLSVVGGLTGLYVDFPSAQRAALTMLAETTGTQLDREDGERIVDQMRRLPPHPGRAPALARLREADLAVAALTFGVRCLALHRYWRGPRAWRR